MHTGIPVDKILRGTVTPTVFDVNRIPCPHKLIGVQSTLS